MNTRVLYLELAALGVDVGSRPRSKKEAYFALPSDRQRNLKQRAREHGEDLHALAHGQGDKDLDAIREEARA